MKKSVAVRTGVIDALLKKYKTQNEEYGRLLSNGFIPPELQAEYEQLLNASQPQTTKPDNDVDLASYSNWFYLHPNKIAGIEVPGTGFINPVITKGSLADVETVINFTQNPTMKKNKKDFVNEHVIVSGPKAQEVKQKIEEKLSSGANEPTKEVEITFEDIFSFATTTKRAKLTQPQIKKAIQQMENKTVVVDKFNKAKGIREQLIIKNLTHPDSELDEKIRKKFAKLSNQQLVNRANKAPDFKWDDEAAELERRVRESNGALVIEMQGNNLVIVKDEEFGVDLFEDYENIPQNVKDVLEEFSDGFEDGNYAMLEDALKRLESIGYTFSYYLDGQAYDLRKIGSKGKTEVENNKAEKDCHTCDVPAQKTTIPNTQVTTTAQANLLKRALEPEAEQNLPELLTINTTLKKYNPGITEAEIKGWVYHKRLYGNPMRGWEKYFLTASNVQDILVYTTAAVYLKNQQFVDVKQVPSGTLLGRKTKFKNEYDKNTFVVVKNELGELYYVNDKFITEQSIGNAAAENELIELVKQKGLCWSNGDYVPKPLYTYGNIYDIKDDLTGKYDRELQKQAGGYFQALIDKFGKEIADWHLQLINDAIRLKGEYYFNDAVPSKRPFLSSTNPISHEFKIKQLNIDSGVDFEKIFNDNKTRKNRWVDYDPETSYSLFQAFEYWFVANVNDTMLTRTTKRNVVDYYINNRNFIGPKDTSDKEKDETKLNARIEGEKFYAEFLATALTDNDIKGLNILFNRTYNSISKINLDMVPVAFETNARIFGTHDFLLNNAQRNGIAFMQATKSGCLAYDVGFGKTLTSIHVLAAMLGQGQVKRPLVVVPKPVYNNWIREMFGFWTDGNEKRFEKFEGAVFINGALTGTKYKLNTWFNLSKNIDFKNEIVQTDTITLMTYEGFYRMGFSNKLVDELFEGLYSILETGKTDGSIREETKRKEGVKKMLGIGLKETLIDVDVCGFDYIVFDEAHAFKNVFGGVPLDKDQNNVWRLPTKGTHTTRAVKAFFSCLYMQKKFGGNVQLLTATPFTNSPLEIFSMLALVGYETLKKYNLQNLYEFLGMFIETEVEYAVNALNEIVLNTVIKAFKNKNLLRDILYRHFDYQDDPKVSGIRRPCKLNFPNSKVSTYLEMTPQQQQAQVLVREQAASYDRRTNPGAMGRALNWAKNNAFTPFMVPGIERYESLEEFIDESPKLKFTIECIKIIKNWHESRNQEMSGQVIYSNRGADYFKDFKAAIENECGFKRNVPFGDGKVDEVEILTGGGSEAELERKELVKDAFNKGFCKVIIGTETIKEGVNLQERGTVLYDLDLDWNPTDFKQLEGRIWRQGNMFKYVRIVVPMVQNTLDSFINQKLDEKSKRISSLWDKENSSNSLEEYAAVDPMEIKFNLIDDAGELLKMKLDKDGQSANKNAAIAEEKYQAINKISIVYAEYKEVYEKLKPSLAETFLNHKTYLGYLEKYKNSLPKDTAKTVLNSIDDLIQKINDNILLFDDFNTNGNFKALFEAFRHMQARSYEFRDAQNNRVDYSEMVEKYTGKSYYGSFEAYNEYNSKKLIATYGDLKKLERQVLQPYGLTVDDNFQTIKQKFKEEHETYKNEIQYLQSIEYKDKALAEIQAELNRRAEQRGTITDRVAQFAEFNYLLSFPFDKVSANQCEVPEDTSEFTGDVKILTPELEKQDEEISLITDLKSNDIKKNKVKEPVDNDKPIPFTKQALVFVPKGQASVSNSPELNDVKERINKIVTQIPTYNKNPNSMVYLHYFRGGSDYFVMETDFTDNYTAVYGYAILNQDYQNAELGSQGLDELKKYMELDYYFTPKPLNEALANVGHPNYAEYKKPTKTEPAPSNTETVIVDQETTDLEVVKEAIELLTEMLPSYSKTDKKEAKEAIKFLKELL